MRIEGLTCDCRVSDVAGEGWRGGRAGGVMQVKQTRKMTEEERYKTRKKMRR